MDKLKQDRIDKEKKEALEKKWAPRDLKTKKFDPAPKG